MKKRKSCSTEEIRTIWPLPDEVIARFGTVQLVRKADGRHVFAGGTAYDQAAVWKWCSRFVPFVGFVGRRAPSSKNHRHPRA